jgi:hypothetical protein
MTASGNCVVINSIHSPRYHRDSVLASGTAFLLVVRTAAEFFTGGVVSAGIVLLTLFLIILLVHFLQHVFDLLFQSCHRSLPFRFLAVLILVPCPELLLLLLGEEAVDLWGYHMFSTLKFFGSFAPFPFWSDFSPPLFNPEIFRSLLFSRVARFSTVVDKNCWLS